MDQPNRDGTNDHVKQCAGCGAKIIWGTSLSGKPTPFDYRKTLGMMDGGEVIWVRISHFNTCPKAEEFRKAKASAKS